MFPINSKLISGVFLPLNPGSKNTPEMSGARSNVELPDQAGELSCDWFVNFTYVLNFILKQFGKKFNYKN